MATIQIEPRVDVRGNTTRPVIELDAYTTNVYERLIRFNAESILSSVFVKSIPIGGSVLVEYFETTTGQDDGEAVLLGAHPALGPGDAGSTDKTLIPRIHNKPFVRVTVTGGPVEIGVYVSGRFEISSDIDSALQLDASDADLLRDKGIPIMCYDALTDTWRMLRCDASGAIGLSEDLTGSTLAPSGTVGTSAIDIPGTASGVITNVFVHNLKSNDKTDELEASFDGGTTYTRIFRGGHLIWTPRGEITQFKLKANAASTEYQTIVNRRIP